MQALPAPADAVAVREATAAAATTGLRVKTRLQYGSDSNPAIWACLQAFPA